MYAYRLPLVKQRFDIKQDFIVEILSWGLLNVYPQSQFEYMKASGVATAAVNKLEDFIVGDGFFDENFGKTILNRQGQTANHLLRDLSAQKSFINTVCLHVGYNALLEVATIKPISTQWYRLVKKGKNAGKIAIWNNWAGENSWNYENNISDIQFLNPFNPDPNQIEKEIEEVGGFANYKGQIFLLNWEPYNHYALSTFDSVIDDVITDAALANYRKNNIKSSFSASGIIKYNANVESEEERLEILKEISSYQGDDEAGNIIVIFPTEGEIETNSPIEFVSIQPTSIDDLYKNQESSINSRIVGLYGQPRALHTFFEDEGIFNRDLIENAWLIYNEQTKRQRNEMSEIFELIIPFMNIKEPESFKIKPQSFGETTISV